ncbi:Tfp pilus assembly protein PilV [Burkholderiales bacterium JOSHI_001]|nr:Tfp pilus assembly protein PilV [Burkholderiales bacterium JOSHI_001]
MKPLRNRSAAARGITLVEALVALAIMAGGMLGYVNLQSTLRQNSDMARQRSEATRLAQERMESLRRFTVVDNTPGQTSYAGLQDSAVTAVAGLSANTSFSIAHSVLATDDPPSKTLSVTVNWTDRSGAAQQVLLTSVVSGTAPALSGALGLASGSSTVQRSRGRHPTIPFVAHELGNGSSAFRASPTVVWIFNNATGVISGQCVVPPEQITENLTPADVASCSNNTVGQFLAGFVRFERRATPALTAADSENPSGTALNLNLALLMDANTDGTRPSWQCFDDSPATSVAAALRRVVGYHCIVYASSSATWTGRSVVTPTGFTDVPDSAWALHSSNPGSYKVCRYTPATDNSQVVANREHPQRYEAVAGNLVNQNFLLISAVQSCPTDTPADLSTGDLVNSNTLLHQP